MKKQILLFVSLIFSVSALTFAQTKTITNADLESFRQKRLAAEKDLRENYEKLGFPSPQELERRMEQSRIEREELAARFQAERIAERQAEIDLLREQNYFLQSQNTTYTRRERTFYYGYSPFFYYTPRFRRRHTRNNNFMPPIRPANPIRPPRVRFY